jgi:hypothetical protein
MIGKAYTVLATEREELVREKERSRYYEGKDGGYKDVQNFQKYPFTVCNSAPHNLIPNIKTFLLYL